MHKTGREFFPGLFFLIAPPLVSFPRSVYASAMNNNTTGSFIKEDPWRIFRIMAEFVDSFEALSQVGPGVTIFGSARTPSKDPYYQATVALARGLAEHKLAVITGGGPGIMEAANKGATRVRGKSVGLNINCRTSRRETVLSTCPFTSITFSRARSAL
jgi:hypothetical protein